MRSSGCFLCNSLEWDCRRLGDGRAARCSQSLGFVQTHREQQLMAIVSYMQISCPVMLSSGCERQQGRGAGGGSSDSGIVLPPFQPSPYCLSVARKSISGSQVNHRLSQVCLKVPTEPQMGRGCRWLPSLVPGSSL